jgi:hypothetical protein
MAVHPEVRLSRVSIIAIPPRIEALSAVLKHLECRMDVMAQVLFLAFLPQYNARLIVTFHVPPAVDDN